MISDIDNARRMSQSSQICGLITDKLNEILEENHELVIALLPEPFPDRQVIRNGEKVLLDTCDLTLAERRNIGDHNARNVAQHVRNLAFAFLNRTQWDLETIKLYAKENPPG